MVALQHCRERLGLTEQACSAGDYAEREIEGAAGSLSKEGLPRQVSLRSFKTVAVGSGWSRL